MANYGMNDLKGGLKVMVDGDPCNIVENEFVKPGKGQAFVRVKLKNLKTGRVVERTYKSNESLESADVLETDLQYLYSDGEEWHFMDEGSFEQYVVGRDVLAGAENWLKEQDVCTVTLWEGNPIAVQPPNFVVLEITETDPGVRGDTASGATKPATVETGAVLKVPLFVDQGELIKVDTRTGEYVARAKD